MTRWARKGPLNKKNPSSASSWSELKSDGHSDRNVTDVTKLSESEKSRDHEKQEKRRLKRIQLRQNQKVCYNCREEGHTMAECKEIRDTTKQSTGICFKCGSNEHTVGRCTAIVKNGEFPFAKCFICDQMGHLSRDCPENPRGLYPNGGCCNLCGSVKHLRRDCTERNKKKTSSDIALPTIDQCASLDEEPTMKRFKSDNQLTKKHKAKVVNF